jgi:nicotinic acid mononucleotide adenylyltransferase
VTTWRRWRDLIRAVRFIVVSRPGHGYDVPEGAKVERLDLLDLPVSSSDIRRRLALGEAPSEVPAAVLEYVARRGLYLSAS